MTLLPILYWIILVLAVIGVFVPTERWPFGARISGFASIVLFVLLGLRVFRIPL